MKLDLRKGAACAVVVCSVSAALISGWEGKKNKAYLDPVNIPTICYGYTHGVRLGQTKTDAECIGLLQSEIEYAEKAIDRLVRVPLPHNTRAAFVSFVYNVGEGTFAKSTLLKKLNAGNLRGACYELPKYVFAKGQKLSGLVDRRHEEKQLCLSGLEPVEVN